jgi:glucokinase
MAKRQIIESKEHSVLSTPHSGYVVAADIGGTNLRLALADNTGAIAARWSSSTAGSRGAAEIVSLIRRGVEDLLRQTSIPREALKAMAVGAPGVTNVDEGIVIITSYLLGWRDVPLREMLESAFNIQVAVDNDVNLAALGESSAGAAQGSTDFVFIAIGTGLGAGIILNGQPFRGKNWSAGEIGYMLVPGVRERSADHGEPGGLEGMIGGEGIKAEWQRQWSEERTALLKELTATEIFDGALGGDQLAQSILEQTARMLAYAIYNMSLVLNCAVFVLGGGIGIHPALGETTRRILEEWGVRGHLQVVSSLLGKDAQLIGAICLALSTGRSRSSFILSP